MRYLYLLLFLCALLPLPALAEGIKDSVYYTMDDGIMSPEEMEQEAQYVFRQCDLQVDLKSVYDCECLAGAFLVQREKLGPMVPQYHIITKAMADPALKCAKGPAVAGKAYGICMSIERRINELASHETKDSQCSCVANKSAVEFVKKPRPERAYLESVMEHAMNLCRDPQQRAAIMRSVRAEPESAASSNSTDFRTLN